MSTVLGRRMQHVEVHGDRTVRRTSRAAVENGLRGSAITGVDRRGKYLIAHLDSGADVMIHLRMSGQVLLAPNDATPPRHTHVVAHFEPVARVTSEGASVPVGQLWFVDPRTFGEVVVYRPEDAATTVPELGRLGVDPIADPFERRQLAQLLRTRARLIKPLLVDQHVIAGIGNIYADEILHRARVHPARVSSALAPAAVTRLHRAIVEVLAAAIEARGSTLADAQYVDLMGQPGSYQSDHAVYGHEGERCRTCGRGVIRRISSGGRSSHFCPVCQRMPRHRASRRV